MKLAHATGRRKNSVAQVRIIPGSGKFTVNKLAFGDYFSVDVYRIMAHMPFKVTKTDGKFDVFATVRGGGKSGQIGALQLGISRALLEFDAEFHDALKGAKLLTRDPRMVERKKYGQKKARKRFQFSKR